MKGHGATADELREDRVAQHEIDGMVESLTRRIKSLLEAIRTAPEDELPHLEWAIYETLAEATHGAHSPHEAADWIAHQIRLTQRFPRIRRDIIESLVRIERVPNMALRETLLDHLQDSGNAFMDVIRAAQNHLLGVEKATGESHGSALFSQAPSNAITSLRRICGMATITDTKGVTSGQWLIPYHQAVAIVHAIGADPVRLGV